MGDGWRGRQKVRLHYRLFRSCGFHRLGSALYTLLAAPHHFVAWLQTAHRRAL
jgi:hypothetical protein